VCGQSGHHFKLDHFPLFQTVRNEMIVWNGRQLWECDVHTVQVWRWLLCIKYYINWSSTYSTRISHQYHVFGFRLTDQPIIVGRVDEHCVSSQWTNNTNHGVSQIGAVPLEVEVPLHRNENIYFCLLQHGKKILDNIFYTRQTKQQMSGAERVLTLHASLQLIK
jgi:hypothetical protein